MKNKVRQLFRDKLVLVMTVLGLLTIVAAAGTVKIRKDNAQDGKNPYLDVPQTEGILAEEMPQNRLEENDGQAETRAQVAGSSDASYSVNNRDEADQKPLVWRMKKRAVWEPEQLPHALFPTMEPIV